MGALLDLLERIKSAPIRLRHLPPQAGEGKPSAVDAVPERETQGVWSAHDVFLQHKRRYTAKSLRPAGGGRKGRVVDAAHRASHRNVASTGCLKR